MDGRLHTQKLIFNYINILPQYPKHQIVDNIVGKTPIPVILRESAGSLNNGMRFCDQVAE
jgi:hypothetical protein